MENQEKRIIEIDGVKLEVDLRQAKVIDHYKVGDNIKVLIKEYNDQYKVYPAVILGFTDFDKTPTIEIAYLDIGYRSAEVKFVTLNDKIEKDKSIEIAPLHDKHDITFRKGEVIKMMDDEIRAAQEVVKDLQRKKRYFEEYFSKFFELVKNK